MSLLLLDRVSTLDAASSSCNIFATTTRTDWAGVGEPTLVTRGRSPKLLEPGGRGRQRPLAPVGAVPYRGVMRVLSQRLSGLGPALCRRLADPPAGRQSPRAATYVARHRQPPQPTSRGRAASG